MTTVNPAASSSAANAANASSSSSSSASSSSNPSSALGQLSGNFDTFLKLLTTQLQNQDPTSPMDSNQFTQQLVMYSQVEQQINSNNNLQKLITQGQNAASQNAVGYLGKTVTLTNGNGVLSGGTANWTYSLDKTAAATAITITNASGKVVYVGQGKTDPGSHQFTWDGKDNAGNQLADGGYKMTVTATNADGKAISSAVASSGKVSQVDMTGDTPQLMIGTMEFPVSDVAAVASL